MSRDARQWRDEITLREASLADARREAAAGELSTEEFAAIEDRETHAITRARAALEAFALVTPEVAAAPVARKRRRSLLLVAFVCFVLVLTVLLVATLTVRQPGTSGTGAVTLNRTQQIAQWMQEAEADTANHDFVAALTAYQEVLSVDSSNVTALTQTGWLDFSAGATAHNASLTTLGVADMRRAITLGPRDAGARLNYAIAAASTPGNRALAVREFRVFLTLSPSAAQRAIAAPFLAQLGIAAG